MDCDSYEAHLIMRAIGVRHTIIYLLEKSISLEINTLRTEDAGDSGRISSLVLPIKA